MQFLNNDNTFVLILLSSFSSKQKLKYFFPIRSSNSSWLQGEHFFIFCNPSVKLEISTFRKATNCWCLMKRPTSRTQVFPSVFPIAIPGVAVVILSPRDQIPPAHRLSNMLARWRIEFQAILENSVSRKIVANVTQIYIKLRQQREGVDYPNYLHILLLVE